MARYSVLLLLLLLWGTARCQDNPDAELLPTNEAVEPDGDPLQLSQVEEVVKSVIDPAIAKLERRYDRITACLSGGGLTIAPAPRLSEFSRDCSDLPAGTPRGVRPVHPELEGARPPVLALCDQDTDGGGWTVIQRRADIKPRQDFFLGWEAYKWGFGDFDGEFWWGLEKIYRLTSLPDRRYQLRIDLEDFDGEKRYALYQNFSVSSEADGYRLHVKDYSGDAGDSLSPIHGGMLFSTKDKDQDRTASRNCADRYESGWWYRDCYTSNLNGPYLSGEHSQAVAGVNWEEFRGDSYSLKTAEMKIKPLKEE